MSRTAKVYAYQNKPMLQRIWSWLTVTLFTKVKAEVQHIAMTLFTIAKTVVKYVSNFIVKHKLAWMSLIGVMTVIEMMYPPITMVVPKVMRLLLYGIVLQKDGTIVSSIVEWLRDGRLDFQSFTDKVIADSREKAQTKLQGSLVICGSCFAIWLGATIAERQIVELAIFAGIALMIALSRSISLFLFTILIGNSVTPFLWIRKARCTPNEPLSSVFDSILLIATTCCCVINTPFANKIIASFGKKNQLQPHSLFALKQALKGIISIVLVWVCGFSPLMLVRSLFLTLGVYQLYELICSDETLLLVQEGFVQFWKTDSPTPTLSEIFKGLSGIIAKLQPYMKCQDAPSKNVLLCVSGGRVLLSIGLAYTASLNCGKMVFTGLCLFSLCISRMEDFYLWGKVFIRKPVLDTLEERFLFCFNVLPSKKERKEE